MINNIDRMKYKTLAKRRIERPLRTDPMDLYDDLEFYLRFKMTKQSVNLFMNIIRQRIELSSHNCLDATTQFLVVLRMLATGAHQILDGDYFKVDQSTVSKTFARVIREIARLRTMYIIWPNEDQARNQMVKFQRIAGFPGAFGCIDGTHVEWIANGVNNRERFRNRKNRLSINVQVVCDADMRVLDVVAKWPGSVHDSRVFNTSKTRAKLENQAFNGWLLGDKGYACKKYLMTPCYRQNNEPEQRYNRSHATTRNVIERMFGAMKRKFAILQSRIRYKLDTTLATIVACMVLWNFLRQRNEPIDYEDEDESDDDNDDNVVVNVENNIDGMAIRKRLINEYFTNR